MNMWFQSEKIIFEIESEGETIQVLDNQDRRELRFGNDVVQSAMSKACPDYLLLSYTRQMTLTFLFRQHNKNILHIGLGAGNLPRFIHKHFPQAHQDVIENNPDVVKIAQDHFAFPQDDRVTVHIGDGLETVLACEKKFDLIFLDAFGPEGSPEHLNTVEFFEHLRDLLKPRGWLVGNLWTNSISSQEQLARWQMAFDTVWKAPVPTMGNMVTFGCNARLEWDYLRLRNNAKQLQQVIPLKFVKMLGFLEPVFPDSRKK